MADEAEKPDDPTQFQRFIDMAREVKADESPDAMERAFAKVVPIKRAPKPSWLAHPDNEAG